jgi:hypothetical protein
MKVFATLGSLGALPRRLLLLCAGLLFLAGALVPTTIAFATPSACDLACYKQVGDKLIAQRLTSLNEVSTKITTLQGKGHLTTDQANDLQGQIATNVNGLKALQTKLDGEQSSDAARQDVKNIFLQFRIYAVFIPKIRHIVLLDVMTNVDQKMRGIQDKIADAIAKAPPSQQGQLNSLFSDYKAQLGEAEAQIDAAQGQLAVLTPNTYNTDRTAYEQAFNMLKTDTQKAHDALKKARDDLHQIAMLLKADKGSSSTPSPTATA